MLSVIYFFACNLAQEAPIKVLGALNLALVLRTSLGLADLVTPKRMFPSQKAISYVKEKGETSGEKRLNCNSVALAIKQLK